MWVRGGGEDSQHKRTVYNTQHSPASAVVSPPDKKSREFKLAAFEAKRLPLGENSGEDCRGYAVPAPDPAPAPARRVIRSPPVKVTPPRKSPGPLLSMSQTSTESELTPAFRERDGERVSDCVLESTQHRFVSCTLTKTPLNRKTHLFSGNDLHNLKPPIFSSFPHTGLRSPRITLVRPTSRWFHFTIQKGSD